MVPARTAELFAPGLRGLSIGLIATITLVALEALAIGTVLPLVGEELGQMELYGWVYSAFFLGNLLGVVVAGGALDRVPLWRPFAIGLVLFAVGLTIGGLAPTMGILVAARFVQGLGGGAVGPTAYVAIGRTLPQRLQPRMFALLSTAWVVPGVVGPSIAAIVGEFTTWRLVFLGLLPLLAVAGGTAVTALRRIPAAAPPEEHAAAAATVRRLPNALLAAAGAGLLVAALTTQQLVFVIGGCGRRPRAPHPGVPAPHPAGHARPRGRRPGRGPVARRDDVRVLQRRRVHPAAAADLARHAGDADRPRVHRDDDRLDRGDVAPGAAHRRLGPAPVRRPGLRLRGDRRA